MIFKRRWFRILAISLGLFLFVGYFAFSTFLFAPHEDDFEHDVAALVPRDVDFFIAKAGLNRDFGSFPRLALLDELGGNPSLQAFMDSAEWADFKAENGVDSTLSDMDAQLGALPLGLDLLDIFGGRDLALAGRFQGSSFADADWAAYGRVNWAGKLGVALLNRGWLGLGDQGIGVDQEEGVLRLIGGTLGRPYYLARVRDVVIVGTSHELVLAAGDLAERRGEGSLLASADYNDNIATAKRHDRRDEIEVILDMRDLLRSLQHQGPWPDPNAEVFFTSFMGRVFQAPACKKVMGVLGLHEGLQLELTGGFASETITDDQRSIYMKRGFTQQDVLDDIGRVAPDDCALFVYLQGPIGVLLKQVFDSMEPEMRNLLEQNIQQTGDFANLDQLVDHVSTGLVDRMALVVTENDYELDRNGPPHDDQVVFMVCLVLWYSDGGVRIDEIVKTVGDNGRIFGLEGANPGDAGFFTNVVGGLSIHEFWSRLIPGTGISATFNRSLDRAPGRGRTYVFNNHMAAGDLNMTYVHGRAKGYPRLSERLDFQALLKDSLDTANLLVWWNPREAAPTLRRQAEQQAIEEAQRSLNNDMDWRPIRQQVEADVLKDGWPGQSRRDLDEADEFRFEDLVTQELAARRREFVRDLAPQIQARTLRRIEWSQAMSSGLMMLKLDPREFRLSVQTVVPLD